ncbi:MAG TPA: DNA gyrase subunit A [Pirellulaceae bacterium]|nr:DNA gyrase subunit A [Pirellulaceae bacterium]
MIERSIEQELRTSYLTYSMSVIVSRALPDVRDGLKPSQRRILVAMNDLNLRPGAARVKCAKISGDTSGNYHPHGESVIYPTLVRMAQEWNMRHILIDKQGNFGSVTGLPAAAMRYTEARLSPIAALMLEDLDEDTVDFVPNYDERRTEPTVLPSKFPNLIVNGAGGIAVGMATSIPPHNLGETVDALVKLIDDPDATLSEILELLPGPDFPTGGTICGRASIIQGYLTGRSTISVRAKVTIEESPRKRLIVNELPYQQTIDPLRDRIVKLINDKKIEGIVDITNHGDLKEPVRLVIDLKRDADPEVVLNQLYQFSPLQDTFSIILLALVDGKPRVMSIIGLLEEFLRHRVTVIRRRTQFRLNEARRRKHVIEGQLLALADIDEIIRIIRTSRTQAEAKTRLMGVEVPSSMMQRALGDEGFAVFQDERGVAETYGLTAVQAEAILRMTLGQLVNLAQEQLAGEHANLLAKVRELLRILSDDDNIRAIVREDLLEIKAKHADKRRTIIDEEEIGDFDLDALIPEENMVVTISHRGYIKRTPSNTYQAQRRGGKGIKGAKVEEEDPVEHLFVASTHAYLLIFTNVGKVYWLKVYEAPLGKRDGKGKFISNVLSLAEGEKIASCRAVRDFTEADRFLLMLTREGLVKKTDLAQYSRPKRGGIIAIKLREGDELIDVEVVRRHEEVLIETATGRAIRFREGDARAMGRNTSGVRGIRLKKNDYVVGMVVTDPDATLLTVCERGYGKRTYFGPNAEIREYETNGEEGDEAAVVDEAPADVIAAEGADEEGGEEGANSSNRYRTQTRGGMGIIDIKTTARNGKVVGVCKVDDDDEVIVMTAQGKIQRLRVAEISVIGRNTQGVRIMSLDEGDSIVGVVFVPSEEKPEANEAAEILAGQGAPAIALGGSAEDAAAGNLYEEEPEGSSDSDGDGENI